jgi:hypothetical protein
MMFFKLEFFFNLKKKTHVHDSYYHKNNIIKKKNHMFNFWFKGDFKTCVLNLVTLLI